jgi:2-polyprenyl-3-methyl-5-hydroxy-6-metoxy-1,4-benzoquinol methylase
VRRSDLGNVEDEHELAAIARDEADTVCWRDPATGDSCAYYHGLWQDLRAVGLGASAANQAGFMADAFALVDAPSPRVLVSGAADHGVLAQVLAACDAHALAPDVTVLDRCEMPLRVNVRFAAARGRAITVCRADILEHAALASYDVIVGHAFLGYFSPDRRRALFQHWASMLRPRGMVVVINRIRGGDPERPVGFTADSASRFLAIAQQQLAPRLSASDLTKQMRRADLYVHNHRVYPLSHEDLAACMTTAGLDVRASTVVTANDPRARDVGGIAVASDASYACMVGSRS